MALILHSVTWSPESTSGFKVDTIDKVPTHHRAQSHIPLHTIDNLGMPNSLQQISLDCVRKLGYLQKTPKVQGEHVNSMHKRRRWYSVNKPTELNTKPLWLLPKTETDLNMVSQ